MTLASTTGRKSPAGSGDNAVTDFVEAHLPSIAHSMDPRAQPSDFLAGAPGVFYECDRSLKVVELTPNVSAVLDVDARVLLGTRSMWDERIFGEDRQCVMSLLEELAPGHAASLTHRVLDRRGLPRWVAHSFCKTMDGGSLRGCLVPLPTEICTRDLAASVTPQFVHKIGNHFQLMNLLLGNLRRQGGSQADIDSLQQALDETVEFTRTYLNYAQAPSAFSEFDLSEILKALMETMGPVFTERKIALHNLLDENFNGVFVAGDPFHLENAFGAIFENALDAIDGIGEVTLMGSLEKHPPDNQLTVHVTVADTGRGMEREVLSRAVEPFFTTRRGRSGLGLSTALRIAEHHGGKLWFTSVAGQGAQVHVILPVVCDSQTPDR